MTSFMMTLMSVAYSVSFGSLRHGPNLVNNESLQISFCQKMLGTDQNRLFMMISISLEHSLSLALYDAQRILFIMSLSKIAFIQ